MRHPFQLLSARWKSSLFWPLLLATLALLFILNQAGEPLVNSEAPFGIVSFEIAGTWPTAARIISSWDSAARLHAAFSLGLDYLFMPVYSCTLALSSLWAGEKLRALNWPLAGFGVPLAWGSWLAAGFDSVENLALILLLFGTNASFWPGLAAWCACLKFGLILLGMAYAFFALVVNFASARSRE
jgi:hypothetical protein